MDIDAWETRDPEQLITEVAQRVALIEDTAYVVLVRSPSTDQEVLEVRRLEVPALLDDDDDISDDLCQVAHSFDLPEVWPPRHAMVTIVVRPGRCVLGPNEGVWLKGWRYANHVAPVFTSSLMLVTEHGWCDLMTDFAGHEPRMASAA